MKIKINGSFYDFFDDITISKKLDTVAATFVFKGRFNPDNQSHKAIYKPLAFNVVEVFNNDDKLLLKGVSLNTDLASTDLRELQPVSGYGKGGVLEDCSIPYSSYPLEKNNITLNELATDLLKPFGLSFTVDSSAEKDMNLQYKKTVARADDTVKSYLSKLASQRNIILGHSNDGELRFFKADTKASPKVFFNEENTESMRLSVSGQGMHSEISVIRQPSEDNPSLKPVDTITNPLVLVKRTLVKILSSGTETDTKKAADNVLAEELKNISVSVSLKKYEDLECGDMVEIQNPEIYFYNRVKMIISELTVKETSSSEEMELKLVLPETFNGEQPKNIFE